MLQKNVFFLCLFCAFSQLQAQVPQPIKQFLQADYMQGATFSLAIRDIQSGEMLYQYDADKEVTPASVLKTVTTATALELLSEDYRFPTTLEYDGEIRQGTLYGNLYIKGSGDPTLGSEHFASDRNTYTPDQNTFMPVWISALKKTGIQTITGSVISDESIFDTEGISPKWVNEDMGNYYGAGSYGISVFDNLYRLTLSTGAAGSKPTITGSNPEMKQLRFHNYLKAASVSTDSAFILGSSFVTDRYLYGVVPANRSSYTLRGDIPDPALFLATYLTDRLKREGITIQGEPSCHRILSEAGEWKPVKRQTITTTYSPPLGEIIAVTNSISHNLYADALLKRIGINYQPQPGEVISSFGKGVKGVENYWKKKGMNTFALRMYDGSGLAPADKVSAAFISELLVYMAVRSNAPAVFIRSLPQAGIEGSVRNFLRGTTLQGKARLKSGGMTSVRSYAGYITMNGKQYAIALFANNYACEARVLIPAVEKMLVSLCSELR